MKKLLVKAGRSRIALTDHSKFGRQSFAYVGPVSDITILVTDSGTDPSYIRDLEAGRCSGADRKGTCRQHHRFPSTINFKRTRSLKNT